MLLPVLLLQFKVVLHVNGFTMKSGILCRKSKFECEMLKTYIATVEHLIILSYGEKNADDCKDFRLRWLSLIILLEAEWNRFKKLVLCIFIQTTIKGSFEVNSM